MSANDPYAKPPVCPHCGGTSEDFADVEDEGFGFDWECPCGALLAEDDIISAKEWGRDAREDQRLSEAGL